MHKLNGAFLIDRNIMKKYYVDWNSWKKRFLFDAKIVYFWCVHQKQKLRRYLKYSLSVFQFDVLLCLTKLISLLAVRLLTK